MSLGSTPLVNVACFSHLGITVTDLDISIDFYTQVLGFIRRFEDVHEGWRRVGLAIGDIQLELFGPHPGRKPGEAVDPFFFITDPDGTPIQLHEFSGGRQRVTELFQ